MKEITLHNSWLIKAPIKNVFGIITNFEKFPELFPKVAESIQIKKRDGNKLEIDAVAKSLKLGNIITQCARAENYKLDYTYIVTRAVAPSEKLIDFSFTKMEEKGLYSTQFVTIHKSFRVNKKYISKYDSKSASVELKVYDKDYMTKTIKLCDVTKKEESSTNPVRQIKVFVEIRYTFLDAAGDSEEEFRTEEVTLDLSHVGAMTMVGDLINGLTPRERYDFLKRLKILG
jgi:hypothetical protein